jgi:hypothetical protein
VEAPHLSLQREARAQASEKEESQQKRRATGPPLSPVYRTPQKPRNTTHAFRKTWKEVIAEPLSTWRRPASGRKKSSGALSGITGVQVAARGERIGRVNWGPSTAGEQDSQPDGIKHKPEGGRQRRRCGHSKRRSGWTTQPAGEPRATGPVVQVRSLRCRMVERPITDLTSRTEIRTVTAYKSVREHWRRWPWRQAGLKPYRGKPAVRNFRGGGRNEVQGLMAICHDARKGGYLGSH